jgi:hypothetical protein
MSDDNDVNDGNVSAAAEATPTQHHDDCLGCLMAGLKEIGISPIANASVDFGAINSDDLCNTLAHSIEFCLDGKGYFCAPLSTGFKQLRAAGTVVTIDDVVSGLMTLSRPK